MRNNTRKSAGALAALMLLSACGGAMDRIARIGEQPQLSPISDPQLSKSYVPVRLPMPAPITNERQPNSLWQAGARAFFKDQRASRIGDILTVVIEIQDSAQIKNKTERKRDNEENATLPKLLGFETKLSKYLPDAIDPTNLAEVTSDNKSTGEGTIDRQDDINLRVAAMITQVLPNGNLVITGKQEVAVNFEKRILQISGVVRPEDISSANAINYDQIAEARIAYGGEGVLSDVQQPRYGQQFFDVVFPF